MSKLIYLDNAATTKTAPEVVEAMLPYFTENFGNPSSVYSFASKNKEAITKQREIIANALGANTNEIYFTAGGSESDNWALKAVLACLSVQPVVAADTLWGIDVSQWQGTINWNQVKAAGVDFVILRGWCYTKDPNFESYYAGAKAAGIPVGVYVYTYGLTESAIVSEVDSLINNCLKGKQFEFPIYVDME